MSRKGFRLAAATSVVAGALVGGLGTAGADVDAVKSKVTIDSGGPDGAEGHISSSERACEKGRTVTLFALPPARGEGEVEIGSDKTNKHGEWAVDEQLFAGDYVAEVAEKTVKAKHPRKKCKRDRSKRRTL